MPAPIHRRRALAALGAVSVSPWSRAQGEPAAAGKGADIVIGQRAHLSGPLAGTLK